MEQKGYPHPPPEMQQQHHYPPPQFQQQMPPTQAYIQPVAPPPVGPDPQRIVCPSCRAEIITKMRYESTTKTHLMALLLCCCFCWPCACLPYCMDSCQNANHYCPNCDAFIGTYSS